jgi:DNA-binding transcriptional regulator GbsR (MarR family)
VKLISSNPPPNDKNKHAIISSLKNSKATNLSQFDIKIFQKMEIINDPITFEILALLLMYRELSLGELTRKVGKSKSTVFRHLQKLIHAGFAQESREQKIRGSINAKFYQARPQEFAPNLRLTPENLATLSIQQRQMIYVEICRATNSSIHFFKKALDSTQKYLESISLEEIPTYILSPDISLNMSFFTEREYQKYLELYRKFMMEFIGYAQQEEKENPNQIRPHVMIFGLVPLIKIFETLKKTISDTSNQE